MYNLLLFSCGEFCNLFWHAFLFVIFMEKFFITFIWNFVVRYAKLSFCSLLLFIYFSYLYFIIFFFLFYIFFTIYIFLNLYPAYHWWRSKPKDRNVWFLKYICINTRLSCGFSVLAFSTYLFTFTRILLFIFILLRYMMRKELLF